MKTLNFFLSIVLIAVVTQGYSQVNSVQYYLKFNTATCLYDAHIVIANGAAQSAPQRTQFGAQYTILVPHSWGFNVVEEYMPLKNNQNNTGTEPQDWSVSNSIFTPAALPEYDFIAVTPKLSPTAQYDTLAMADTVKIFSFEVTPTTTVNDKVRLYRNGLDPMSSDPGMGGGDFSQGFTMGGISQLYSGNVSIIDPPAPVVSANIVECDQDLEIEVNVNGLACLDPLTYNWEGPNNFSSTAQSFVTVQEPGTYRVTVTNALGVEAFDSVYTECGLTCEKGNNTFVGLDENWFDADNWIEGCVPDISIAATATITLSENVTIPTAIPMGILSGGTLIVEPGVEFSTTGPFCISGTLINQGYVHND